jgi:hypothetical protein
LLQHYKWKVPRPSYAMYILVQYYFRNKQIISIKSLDRFV